MNIAGACAWYGTVTARHAFTPGMCLVCCKTRDVPDLILDVIITCCIVLQRDAKEKGRKEQERKQETERHTQGTEPSQQHRPTQNTTEAENAAQDQNQPEQRKSNNQALHNPEQAGSPKATYRRQTETCDSSTQLRSKQVKRKGAVPRQAGEGGNLRRQNPPSPGSKGAHPPPVRWEEGQKGTTMRYVRQKALDRERRQDGEQGTSCGCNGRQAQGGGLQREAGAGTHWERVSNEGVGGR
jgi:hypothetical protein